MSGCGACFVAVVSHISQTSTSSLKNNHQNGFPPALVTHTLSPVYQLDRRHAGLTNAHSYTVETHTQSCIYNSDKTQSLPPVTLLDLCWEIDFYTLILSA